MFGSRIIHNKKRQAFTMVEVMMLLLMASLIVAASVPLITRRHLLLPAVSNHGSYMCYYKNGQLMEARTSGRINQKMLAGYPRATVNCVFEPPTKASLFQIVAIGGGGGGSDAGYRDVTPTTYTSTEHELLPFGKDNNGLTLQDLLDIGVKTCSKNGSDPCIKEVEDAMGEIFVFAEGAESSLNGPIDYVKYDQSNLTYNTYPCPDKFTYEESSPEGEKINLKRTITLCSANGGDPVNVWATTSKACVINSKYIGGYLDFPTTPVTCEKTEQATVCTEWDVKECTTKKQQTVTVPTTYKSGYTLYDTVETSCENPCQYKGQKNCNAGPCYKTVATPVICTGADSNIRGNDPNCIDILEHDETKWVDVKDYCTFCTKYEDKEDTITWEESINERQYWGDVDKIKEELNGESSDCNWVNYSPTTTMNTITYYPMVTKCEIPEEERQIAQIDGAFSLGTDTTTGTRGVGAYCVAFLDGSLGLKYKEYFTAAQKPLSDNGDPVNRYCNNQTEPCTSFGQYKLQHNTNSYDKYTVPYKLSFCDSLASQFGIGLCGPSIGKVYNNTYNVNYAGRSKVCAGKSLEYCADASSAAAGPKGRTLYQNSVALPTGFDEDNGELTYETFYYDVVNNNSERPGTAGSCNSGESYPDRWYDCRGKTYDPEDTEGHIRTGYCLTHQYTDRPELSGKYRYHDTYDTNYLNKGMSGDPGEFKIIMVRSLNGVDKTIHVGRGGSAAALNLGNNGSPGSDTTFGTILTAKGGGGGIGHTVAFDDKLPPFNKSTMDYKNLIKCFTTNELNNNSTCQGWKAHPEEIPFYKNSAGDTGNMPTKSFIGGMFNFIASHFTMANNNIVKDLLELAGKGGSGGGVEHFCWAGQRIIYFEGEQLLKSSVYYENSAPAGALSDNKIPADCQTSYRNVPATSGYDGALIITW